MATTQPVEIVRDGQKITVRLGGPIRRPYLEVADRITAAITRGVLRSGDRLPGEIPLSQALECSRDTVRHGYSHLAEQGVVRSEHGRGWIVN